MPTDLMSEGGSGLRRPWHHSSPPAHVAAWQSNTEGETPQSLCLLNLNHLLACQRQHRLENDGGRR